MPNCFSSPPKIALKPPVSAYPERLLIFHGGTARIAFLASLKMTTVLVAGFFTFILAPRQVIMDATQPLMVPVAAAVCGIIPFAFVWRTTYPLVTYMHIRIPTYARTTRSALEKWVNRGVNPATEMEITSMTFLARPKQVAVKVGDLVPSNRMLGYANWRVASGVDVNQGPLIRRGGKWWHAPPLKEFSISGFNRDAREGWVWTELGRQIHRRAVMKGLGEP